jgi:predicted metal-dependent HD superfamily phosphohydrolase
MPNILADAEAYVKAFFNEKISPKYVFHDYTHTAQVVDAARVLAESYSLSEKDQQLLQLAAWFHDTGYTEGTEDHETRSASFAQAYLQEKVSENDLERVVECIYATRMPQTPETLQEQILCDADLSHLGMKNYWDRTGKIREEFAKARNIIMNEQDWIDFEINFMVNHEYHTKAGRELFDTRKAKHIEQLLKQRRRLNPDAPPTEYELMINTQGESSESLKKTLSKTEKELNQARLSRGVETMYRTTYGTNNNLSRMADSKANMMLSINTIVISIIVSNLIPRLSDNHRLVIPTALLLLTCLLSMIFATLSTRPKITEGTVTKEDIKEKRANLLFFGNFHNMQLQDYQWGINEMLKDPEFLYNTMSKDLYFLGIVLAKKYTYLSYCYSIFMWGLIVSVISFIIAFAV